MAPRQFYVLETGLFFFSDALFLCKCIEYLLHYCLKAVSWKPKKYVCEQKDKICLKFMISGAAILTPQARLSLSKFTRGMFQSVKLDNLFSGDAASTGSA